MSSLMESIKSVRNPFTSSEEAQPEPDDDNEAFMPQASSLVTIHRPTNFVFFR